MPAVIPIVMAGMSIAGKVAEGRAKGRAQETQINTQRDALTQDNYQAQLDAAAKQRAQELEERKFQINAPRAQMAQALRGTLMQNLQLPGYAGGTPRTVPGQTASAAPTAAPQGLDALREGAGSNVQGILASLLKGQQFDPMVMQQAPGLTPLPKAGKFDSLLNILGTVGSIGGAAYGARGGASTPSPQPFNPAAVNNSGLVFP